jgi:hypothetical protein
MDNFQGGVIDALNAQDANNKDLLEQVISAAAAVGTGDNDVTIDPDHGVYTDAEKDQMNDQGAIVWGNKAGSLSGTGGVALLEYAKDAIQTAVSNISGVGTNQITARKNVERKMGNLG